jgi:DNA-binding NtrC family response regulator
MTTQDTRPQVLILDDEEIQRTLIKRILTPDYAVFTAADADEADQILLRNPQIQVILCDHKMPGTPGLVYCKQLADRRSEAIRVMMTGLHDLDLLQDALNSRAIFHYISKPMTAEDLFQCLQKALSEYHLQQTTAKERELAEKLKYRDQSHFHRFAKRAQMIFGLGSIAFITLFLLLIAGGVIGALIFLALYLLKSFLGIDIFEDSHLRDWL